MTKLRASTSVPIGKVAGFALTPVLSIVAPLLTIPIVAERFSNAGWASIAVGQSVGSAFAVVVELGWSITGPVQASRSSKLHGASLYRRSLGERSVVYVLLIPLIVVAIHFTHVQYAFESSLTALATAAVGLSAAWFYIGTAAPRRMVIFDTVPRVASAIAGASLLILGLPLIMLPLPQLVVAIIIPLVPLIWLGRPQAAWPRDILGLVRSTWISQRSALVARMATTAYVALPTTFLALVAASPLVVSQYAAYERVSRTGLAALQPLSQAFQGWVPAAVDKHDAVRRMRAALIISVVVGVSSSIALLLLGNIVVRLLFRGRVILDENILIAFSIVVVAVVVSRCTGNQCLATIGAVHQVAYSTVVGFLFAVPAILTAASLAGATGVAWAIASTEVIVLLYQVAVLALRWRSWKSRSAQA